MALKPVLANFPGLCNVWRMNAFNEELSSRLKDVQEQGLFRQLHRMDSPQRPRIEIDPAVVRAAVPRFFRDMFMAISCV